MNSETNMDSEVHKDKNIVRFEGEPWQHLFKVLKDASGARLCIIIKGYPDPDSIASSLALKLICSQFDINCTILYFDEISHYENRALVKKLEIEMVHYTQDFNLQNFDYVAFNDTQSHDLPIDTANIPPLLVFIDHHKNMGNIKSKHIDIRENIGSCSSIYAEYLKESKFPLTTSDGKHIRIATALMHGIRSDTDNFILAREADYAAASYLSEFLDPALLSTIASQPISSKGMDIVQYALQNKIIKGTVIISGIGFVRDSDRDGIGLASDFLLRREGIETSIVFGVVGDSHIDGSLRTKSTTLEPDRFLKETFGMDFTGKYFGGGRSEKGGFQIPLGIFGRCSDKTLLWKLIQHTVQDVIFDSLGLIDSTKE